MHYTPVQFVAFALAFALAALRLLTASKPFWSATRFTKYLTVAGPALLAAFAAVPAALSGATSWTDVAVALLSVTSVGFAAAHGKTGSPSSGDSIPVEAVPTSKRPPGGFDVELRGLPHRLLGRVYAFSLLLVTFSALSLSAMLCSCTPGQWQAQADAADAVAKVSNAVVAPALQEAYTAGALAVIKQQATAEDVQLAQTVYEAKWAPVWRTYDAFKRAHDAWQDAIDHRGDVVKLALDARVAFCELRVAAATVKVHLPDFQPLRCGS